MTRMIAAICIAGEYTRPIFHAIALILNIVAVVTQILRRTETLRANASFTKQFKKINIPIKSNFKQFPNRKHYENNYELN